MLPGRSSLSRRIFLILNILFLSAFSFACLYPLINVLAVSLSSRLAADTGMVTFLPVEFTLSSYEFILKKKEFLTAFLVSGKRLVLGVAVNMFLTIITAYPLSRENKEFRMRTVYVWIFVATMLFNGGLIPTYLTVRNFGLIDSIFALVIPTAIPVFNMILLINFFRSIPKELSESAFMDGAGHWNVLWKIYVPVSLPALATLVVFASVFHWNSWFDGMIYMNNPNKFPLQTYLQKMLQTLGMEVTSYFDAELMKRISNKTVRSAQIFAGMLPILLIYPFMQKYFTKGLVLGSVKG